MPESRPPIPADVAHEVRQRCGFGCVFDGNPIFDYDHIDEYSQVHEHQADNLTLLCPAHHREKSSHRLDVDLVRSANAAPFNRRHQYSPPFAWNTRRAPQELALVIGGNTFTAQHQITALVIDDDPIVTLSRDEDDILVLDALLLDRYNQLALLIQGNQLVFDTGLWDIRFSGQTLTVRNGDGLIAIEIRFGDSVVEFLRGHFWHNGVDVELSPDSLRVMDPEAVDGSPALIGTGNRFSGLHAGIALGRSASVLGAGIRNTMISRYPPQGRIRSIGRQDPPS